MEISKDSEILVTGGTGYVASHVIKLLLEEGYKVRSTVRSLAKKENYNFLYELVPSKKDNLSLVEADLLDAQSWDAALEGIKYVLHVASPFTNPTHEDEVIRPAVEGTLNVLNAALVKGVKKVVLTSSVVAVYYGNEGKVSGPEDWSIEEHCDAYAKSKLRAEKAAWDLWKKSDGKFELATVNPGFILGPIYSSNGGKSEQTVVDLLTGTTPGIPNLNFAVVDVRDVAECHLRALTSQTSNGKRYLCAADSIFMGFMSDVLHAEFSQYGYKVTTFKLPKLLLRIAGIFDKRARSLVPEVDVERKVDNKLSVEELGIKYRNPRETLIDMGYSLIKTGVIQDKTASKAGA